ncbi:MAG: ribbon-helix-helix protein, CopG family [Labilithrix sp.]|nr:ribbon-helix-helix protein, CopG family [Labilithrix sp.]MBX3222129.1 ribbon-helix-helix protein, CopG family [Labilithrix sp.]
MKKASRKGVRKARRTEPTKASLKEIPEVDFSKARVRRNPHAARIAKEGITVQVGRGRPKKLAEVGGTTPRSVRFPDDVWRLLEVRAKKEGLTLHAALRQAILAWIEDAA